MFPQPAAPENCSRCSEAGVLGPVPGVIGTLQALEVIKIAGGEGTAPGGLYHSFFAIAPISEV